MKVTIQIDGVPVVSERWEVGQLAHEQRGRCEPVRLEIEHDDGEALVAQIEGFVERSITHNGEPVLFPSFVRASAENAELARKIDDLNGAIEGRSKVIAEQRAMIETLKVWKRRAFAGLEIAGELQALLAGSATRWPKGLRKRLTELRAEFPATKG